MTTRLPAQCLSCKHWVSPLDRDDPEARGDEPTQICAAYPAGIPDEIWWNRADHREPYDGDHGIRWEAGEDYRNGGKMTFPEYAMNL